MDFSGAFNRAKDFVTANRPTLLIGAGTGLMLVGTVTAAIQSLKVTNKLDEKYLELCPDEELDTKTIIKEVAPMYIVPGLATIGGVTLIIFGLKDANDRLVAGAEALRMSSGLIDKMEEVIEERHGAQERKDIHKTAAKRFSDEESSSDGDAPERTGNGADLFYEPLTGKYFYSDKATIRQVVRNLDEAFASNGDVCLTDFLAEMNLGDSELADRAEWVYDPVECRSIGVYFDNYEGKSDRVVLSVRFDPEPEVLH